MPHVLAVVMQLTMQCVLTEDSDYVICTGADCGTDISIPAFAKLTALGDHSTPFDDNRNGFVMGSGAGTLVLQAEDKTHS